MTLARGKILRGLFCLTMLLLFAVTANAASDIKIGDSEPFFTLSKNIYAPGETITVTTVNIPQTMVDDKAFVAVYPSGASHESYQERHYLKEGIESLALKAPALVGSYEMRLYSKDGVYTDETLVLKKTFTVDKRVIVAKNGSKRPNKQGGSEPSKPGGTQPNRPGGTQPNKPVDNAPPGSDRGVGTIDPEQKRPVNDPPGSAGETGTKAPADKDEQDKYNEGAGKSPIPVPTEADKKIIAAAINGTIEFTGTRQRLYDYVRDNNGLRNFIKDNINGQLAEEKRAITYSFWKTSPCTGDVTQAQMTLGVNGTKKIVTLKAPASGGNSIHSRKQTLSDGTMYTINIIMLPTDQTFTNDGQNTQLMLNPAIYHMRAISRTELGNGKWKMYELNIYFYVDSAGYIHAEGTGIFADSYTVIIHDYFTLKSVDQFTLDGKKAAAKKAPTGKPNRKTTDVLKKIGGYI